MFRALQTAALGMSAQQMSVDNIANNLANVNTTGFKKSTIAFQDLFYQTINGSDSSSSASGTGTSATDLQIGLGSRPAETIRNFSEGSLDNTGNPLDMAISGQGFFQVLQPDGSVAYTRDGTFTLNSNGTLVNSSGLPLASQIQVTPNTQSVQITKDGTINAMLQGQTQPVNLGQLQLARFVNPEGLRALGDNLYAPTVASGQPYLGTAGSDGFGSIEQGFLEKSNVDIVNEMVSLITAQRAYEINSKMIQTADQMMSLTNALKQ